MAHIYQGSSILQLSCRSGRWTGPDLSTGGLGVVHVFIREQFLPSVHWADHHPHVDRGEAFIMTFSSHSWSSVSVWIHPSAVFLVCQSLSHHSSRCLQNTTTWYPFVMMLNIISIMQYANCIFALSQFVVLDYYTYLISICFKLSLLCFYCSCINIAC